ncbi:MAG: DUF1045 domain-containing protein [Caldimonas sp.]
MRYALYFSPNPEHPLLACGNAWLGRDAETGEQIVQPDVPGFDRRDIEALTAAPRRYGFHATIKAPFALAEDTSRAELHAFASVFGLHERTFDLPPLAVAVLDDFIALRPAHPAPPLQALADACVMHFDRFRAPPGVDEDAARRGRSLDEAARRRLERWGYPHVFEGFRFHLTLTGRLDAAARERLLPWLRAHFAGPLAAPLRFDALALFVEPAAGAPFRLETRLPLATAGTS